MDVDHLHNHDLVYNLVYMMLCFLNVQLKVLILDMLRQTLDGLTVLSRYHLDQGLVNNWINVANKRSISSSSNDKAILWKLSNSASV
eukprot:UN06779